MKIGLYFGSFNPIHTGHLIIAQHFLNQTDLRQVWFVVTPQNPLKPSGSLLNEYHRLHLVRLGIGDNPGIKASDAEFYLPKPSYTSITLAYLEEKHPQHEFALLMGSDSYLNLPNWHNAPFLMTRYPIYVYERPGFAPPEVAAKTTVLKAPLLNISASHVRTLLKENKPITYLVPREVEHEIEKNHYYR